MQNPLAGSDKNEKGQPAASPLGKGGVIDFLSWNQLIDPKVLTDFTSEFGVEVRVEYVKSNEEILERLQSGKRYDLILPSGYLVAHLIRLDMLLPLNELAIPNLTKPRHPFNALSWDPECTFSIPYLWFSYGIVYNSDILSGHDFGLKQLFDPSVLPPETRQLLHGKTALLQEQRYALAFALLYLGFSPDSTVSSEIQAAGNLLQNFKPDSKGFIDRDTLVDLLIRKKVLFAQATTALASLAFDKNPKLAFSLPLEGSPVALRNIALPKTTDNKHQTEQLINFLLRPQIIGRIVNYSRAGCVDAQALAFVAPQVKNGPAFWFPETKSKTFLMQALPPAAQRVSDQIWTELIRK